MLKVHSLFPKHSTSCQVAIQTQSPIHASNIQFSTQVFKNCKLRDSLKQSTVQNKIPSLSQSYNSYEFVKLTKARNFRISKKENIETAERRAKIQATKFNFIKFEDTLLRQALKKYMKRVPLTKAQNVELYKQIKLGCFIEGQQPQNNIYQRKLIQRKQNYAVMSSIKQIIDIIVKLSPLEKDAKGQIQQSQIKKIEWKVQKIIAMKQPIRIGKEENSQNLPSVFQILEKYVKSIEAEEIKPVFNKKGYLQRFYEEIFIRYENTPFSEQLDEEKHISDSEEHSNQPKPFKNSSNSRGRSSNLNTHTVKSSVFYSQKINRFENNLRKQMRNLAEQSERIVVDQNKKVSKF